MENGLDDCPLAAALAERLREARDPMTQRWLERIAERVTLDPGQIFPSQDLLDHVPLLVDGIADYMEDPADEISADVPVIAKAMELGELRLAQGFGVHQILKEYEILGGVLFTFLIGTVDSIPDQCSRGELLACAQRLFRAISVIQQVTTLQYVRLADERVREREDRLRSFNRMVSHELKNSIGAVDGASSMLQEPWVGEDPEQRGRFVAIIHRNTGQIQKVLQDLLTLSRMDGDSRQQRNVLLAAVAQEAARQLRDMARDRNVEIRISDDLPAVEVDAGVIELCLVNFISNGIKYADPAKLERWVEVRGYHTDDTGERDRELVIEVRDNGLGIAATEREQVFDRFFRSGDVTDVEGTGLGLSIVRETVESAGGRVWVERDEGDSGGSIFRFALPARREEEGENLEVRS